MNMFDLRRVVHDWLPKRNKAPSLGPLQQIWVDLTPMLRGGANGGTKPFILTLLRELAKQQAQALFHSTCRPEVVKEVDACKFCSKSFINQPLPPASTNGIAAPTRSRKPLYTSTRKRWFLRGAR